VVFVGEDEIKSGEFAVKDIKSGEQQKIVRGYLVEKLR